MSDDLDLDAAMAAAEQAAGSGDFTAAERHLRDAARLQEEALGTAHPDLANTLNNLGVVYERTGRADEAEASYRRAYAIARETLAPDHPFVATSEQNLREFCETNGRPFDAADAPLGLTAQDSMERADDVRDSAEAQERELPPPPSSVEERTVRPDRSAPSAEERAFKPARTSTEMAPAVTARTRRARRRMLLLLASIAAVVVIWLFARPTSPPRDGAAAAETANAPATGTPAASSSASAAEQTAPASAPSALVSAPPVFVPDAASSSPSTSGTAARSTGTPSAASPPVPPPAPHAAPSAPLVPAPFPTATRADAAETTGATVVRADVCAHFSTRASAGADWRCDVVGGTAEPGVLVFYTRIRSPRPTTVEHRWYRGDTLVQRVRLRISANPGAGYRTYSRNTVGAGAWRVELRASDDTLLHEARFTVP